MKAEVTLSDLMELEEKELRKYAKLLDLPMPKQTTKQQVAEMLLGKKCFGCGKK